MRLKDIINIKRKTETDLGHGSFSETYDIVSTNVKASVQQRNLQNLIQAGRKINPKSYVVYTSPTEDIQGDDIIEYLGEDFSIVGRTPYTNVYLKLFIELVKNNTIIMTPEPEVPEVPIVPPVDFPNDLTSISVAQYKMNDNLATTVVINELGTNADATVNTDTIDVSDGKINNALSCAEAGAYINTNQSFSTAISNNFGNSTVNFWIRMADVTPAAEKGICGGKDGVHCYKISIDGTNLKFLVDANDIFPENISISATHGMSNNTWHMITAVIAAGTNGRLYVDNVLIGSNTNANAIISSFSTLENFYIGRYNDGIDDGVTADIDSFVFFDDDITTGDIEALWNLGRGTEEISN